MSYEKNNTRRSSEHHTDVAESVWTRYYEVKEKEAALHEEIEKSGAPGVPSRRGVQVSHTSYSSNFPLRPTEVQRETSGGVVRSHSRVELESATFHVGSYVWGEGEFKHLDALAACPWHFAWNGQDAVERGDVLEKSREPHDTIVWPHSSSGWCEIKIVLPILDANLSKSSNIYVILLYVFWEVFF